jgi:chromosome segregation ATPase
MYQFDSVFDNFEFNQDFTDSKGNDQLEALKKRIDDLEKDMNAVREFVMDTVVVNRVSIDELNENINRFDNPNIDSLDEFKNGVLRALDILREEIDALQKNDKIDDKQVSGVEQRIVNIETRVEQIMANMKQNDNRAEEGRDQNIKKTNDRFERMEIRMRELANDNRLLRSKVEKLELNQRSVDDIRTMTRQNRGAIITLRNVLKSKCDLKRPPFRGT